MLDDDAVKQITDGDALLLDVRTKQEYESEKSPYATNIDVNQLSAGALPETGKDKPVYVFCRSGARAELAKHILEHKGFEKVTNVGGYVNLPDKLK